ncbi:MAG: cysteine synthase family protein, partial [Oscillospiraceae bacterium]|nr:cysteine synthase family protein [Oscillospiraceae bacterium]
MNIFNSLSELVGKTPLLKLNNVIDADSKANVFAKLEYFNPAGSVKDRVALKMIEDAEKNGEIKSGATLIEATSGNTGIGICALAAAKGYRAIIVMPETMSEERKKLMTAYGAELVLTEGKKGMQGAIDKANELYKEIDGAFLTKQFENESNSRAHFESTGPEIYADLDGKV